jgi:hypothetical protein
MTDHTTAESFLYNDVNGNVLTFHPNTQDEDGVPSIHVEVEQLGYAPVFIPVRQRDALRVATELCHAAGLPAFTERAAWLSEAARVADCMDAPAVAAALRQMANPDA